jgi:Putative methyltransferase
MIADRAVRAGVAARRSSPPRDWRLALAAAGSRAGALLSEGLRLGYRHGFDSGPFMTHVYADRARGRTPLGRRLDRRFLDRRTCEAFRDIRALAETALRAALDAHPGQEPLVADLAAGPAPQLVAALRERPGARGLACDVDPVALVQARERACTRGVADRMRFARSDAFDRAALAALDPRPDVVLELGLYGIYRDDELIERHFHDLAELVAPRQVVFNVQTQNPEIDLIARAWRDRHGEPCAWRLRPLETLLGYAGAAGYEPVSVTADRHGIYRVVRLVRTARAR